MTRQPQPCGHRIQAVRPTFVTSSRLRSAFALALALWCAGTGCLLVSYANGMAMGGVGVPETNARSPKDNLKFKAGSRGGHACCKARHRALGNDLFAKGESENGRPNIDLPGQSSSPEANSCCPLTSGSFVSAARGQTDVNHGSGWIPAQALDIGPSINYPATCITQRLLNHEHTYLSSCALLI